MDKVVDFLMTRLILLAEKVCSSCSFLQDEPNARQDIVEQNVGAPIRFSNEDKYVEGELFN